MAKPPDAEEIRQLERLLDELRRQKKGTLPGAGSNAPQFQADLTKAVQVLKDAGLGHLLTPRRTKVGRQSTTDGDTGKTQSSPDGLKKKWHHGLKYGDTITNQQLQEIFQCSSQGGMRRALRTNSLVLISDHTKTSYHDRWQDGYFHYTGMGLKGDQSLAFAQNKTLAQSRTKVVYVKFCKLVMAFFGRAFFKD